MKITIISGDAGTGKTYYLAKFIESIKDKKFHCLAFTHSALNNLWQTYHYLYPNSNVHRDVFSTIHSFFRINPEVNRIGKFTYQKYDYIIIDEYSLISIALFNMIKDVLNEYCDNLIICGDYKQLRTIDYKKSIDYVDLDKYLNIFDSLDKDKIDAICHYENSILSLPFIKNNTKENIILTEQKRNNNIVSSIIDNLCFHDGNYKSLIITKPTLFECISHGFTFIASRYDYLQEIHEFVSTRLGKKLIINQHGIPNNIGLEKLYLENGDKIIITENIKYGDEIITNGDEFTFIDYSNNLLYLQDDNDNSVILSPLGKGKKLGRDKNNDYLYFPILPSNMITYHKSQGKTYENVVLCIDRLFDFTMLYTGLSRAKSNVLLFSVDGNNDIPFTAKKYEALNRLV